MPTMLHFSVPTAKAIAEFVVKCLAALTLKPIWIGFSICSRHRQQNLAAMSQLDAVHAQYFGTPVPHPISIGVRNRPAILVTGHDLADLDGLLDQTRGTGVDVYTHSEMIAAHYYPKCSHTIIWWETTETHGGGRITNSPLSTGPSS